MAGEAFQLCRDALKKLKEVSSSFSKGLADPELRQLRETVRATCLKALQLDYEKSQVRFKTKITILLDHSLAAAESFLITVVNYSNYHDF
jgi:hypothetical protein